MIERGNWLLEFIEEWSQFFEPCNWYTFHPIKIEFENDSILGGVEVSMILLGFGFRWRWNHTVTEELAGIIKDVDDIKSGRVQLEGLPKIELPAVRQVP